MQLLKTQLLRRRWYRRLRGEISAAVLLFPHLYFLLSRGVGGGGGAREHTPRYNKSRDINIWKQSVRGLHSQCAAAPAASSQYSIPLSWLAPYNTWACSLTRDSFPLSLFLFLALCRERQYLLALTSELYNAAPCFAFFFPHSPVLLY